MRSECHLASLAAMLAQAVWLAGCQRSSPPAESPDSVPTPTTTGSQRAASGTLVDGRPPGVLLAHVWECDDGRTIKMRNLLHEHAVALDLQEGTQRLAQVVSASGARYANDDESIVFWTKGGGATLERSHLPTVKCTERRADSLRVDARLRGVSWRALGNEPGWVLEIGPDNRVDWTTNYGQERHVFDVATETTTTEGTTRTFVAANHAGSIEVVLSSEPCVDDAGITYDFTALVRFGGDTLRGCASRLD